jgi:hypothetical protein
MFGSLPRSLYSLFMLLEVCTVSRKTPTDGRLLITPAAATTLRALGADVPLATPGGYDRARVTSMTCSCGKEGPGGHEHHFIESPILRSLPPGSEVRLILDDNGSLVIS